MKHKLLALTLISLFSTPVLAEKPEWAGKGKPTEEQLSTHKAAMEAKEDLDDNDGEMKKEKIKEEKKQKIKDREKKQMQEMNEDPEKMEATKKQAEKKSEQTRNELGKGSDKGQQARQENSKKWWKFWGE